MKSVVSLLQPRAPKWIYLIYLIGAATLTARGLLLSGFANSSLLYLGLPFVISLMLHHFIGYSKNQSALGRYLNHLRNATVVMLGSSALLFEGFICVLMFMPIYYLAITIGFVYADYNERRDRRRKSRVGVYAVPLIVMVLSLEGVVPTTSLPRLNAVTHVAVVETDIRQLKENMARPIRFDAPRNWFLSIFPLPVDIRAGSLASGDVHELDFVYKRWFFTNLHRGRLRLLIEHVGERDIRTRVIENTSYLANYLEVQGTEIRFTDLGEGLTEIALTISYRRLLDPAWYFGPLQRFAMEENARYFVENIIAREQFDG
ncbi:hypothetical protein [Pelagibius sp. Alg239-R121]|uniref:hypothetical protein n=1 Tax=Pelagibius sp. Alg239-R121 TaxID=2993448 RepID=UPI0024A77B69|nr:hypothetical protein [Pelagibius sp. Alg239-R121]